MSSTIASVDHILLWERLISCLVTKISKSKTEFWRYLLPNLLAALLILHGIYGDFRIPIALFTSFLICALPIILSIELIWPTFKDFDHNFYEHHDFSSTSKRITEPLIYHEGKWLTASSTSSQPEQQQCVQFRGINLPAKTPLKSASIGTGKITISFIDRPFPLIDAPSHFKRLSNYGFNLVRLTVTWEAVMHDGPGIIDRAYLQYLSELVDVACANGIYVLIDPHQDVWSRMTGGDGAPEWTLDKVGFNVKGGGDFLHQTGVAWLHPLHRGTNHDHSSDYEGNMEPDAVHMGWTTNMGRLATATMFTLFFAGDEYAQGITIEDDGNDHARYCTTEEGKPSRGTSNKYISIQSYLQKYYLQFLSVVAEAVKDKPNVLGFNTMNEPSCGMVGISDLSVRSFPIPLANPLSFFDGMRLGSGEALRVEQYNKAFLYQKTVVLNPNQKMVWKSKEHDIWRIMEIYEVDEETQERRLLQPNYFKLKKGKHFLDDFMVPFYEKVRDAVCAQNERFVIFAEPHVDVMNFAIDKAPESLDEKKFAWAPHWYDGLTILKSYLSWVAINPPSFLPVFTKRLIDKAFTRTMYTIKSSGKRNMYVLLGETGVPINIANDDIEHDDYAISTMALDRTFRAIEKNNFDCAMWNYCYDNSWLEGDGWNGEDFSIRSTTGVIKNRILLSTIRPFVVKVGVNIEVVSQRFHPNKYSKQYELIVRQKCHINTEDRSSIDGGNVVVFIPQIHFAYPRVVLPSSSKFEINPDLQELVWKGVIFNGKNGKKSVRKLLIVNDYIRTLKEAKK